jgi:hypothetical protein
MDEEQHIIVVEPAMQRGFLQYVAHPDTTQIQLGFSLTMDRKKALVFPNESNANKFIQFYKIPRAFVEALRL